MKLLALFSLLFLVTLSYGQKTLCLSSEQHGQLDSISTQDVPENAPGIATAIIQNGNVIYKKYAGMENLEKNTLINEESRFNIASNGKQFTALAILQLVEQNELSLSDDIRKWFSNLYPTIKEDITIKDLLNHTSGIRDCYDLWSLQGYTWWKESFDNKDVLRLTQQQSDLNFEPGSRYLYSNTNYILLALIVEKVTDKTFVQYTNEMFGQLNMPNTSFVNDHSKLEGNIARAYFNFGTWSTYDWIWNVHGDGNIFSTLEDQIQWEKLVQGQSETSFSREVIAQSQLTIENSTSTNYGYGLEFGKYKGKQYRFHEGSTGAWKATTIRFPKSNLSMVTLTNTGKAIPSYQTRQMADVVLEFESAATQLVTQPQSVGRFIEEDEILGTYLTKGDFAFTFLRKDGKIFLNRIGRGDVELEREEANIFHQKYDPAFKQEFTTTPEGKVQVTAYHTSHSPYSLTKVGKIENGFAFDKLEGDYLNKETNTSISIKHLKETDYEVTFHGEKKRNGLLVSNNKMLVGSYSFAFANGKLLLNGERIKAVVFERQQ